MQIEHQTALITGGASGMGAQTAQHLAALGARIVVFDKDAKQAEQLAHELHGIAYALDICDEAQVQLALDDMAKKQNIPRFLINCAGIAPAKRILGKEGVIPQHDFEKVIRINLLGTFNVLRLVSEKMSTLDEINGQRGVIINTASIAAFEGQIGQAAYSASKAGIVGLTLPCARDLAKWAIRVMTIAPGIMDTPMMVAMPEAVKQSLAATVPFPKRLGAASEFAKLVQHIIENDYLNGSTIRLDGALRMQG